MGYYPGMNNAQQITGTEKHGREQTTEEARRMSVKYAGRRVYVTQTSCDSFNFHFDAYNIECGMLLAIFVNGQSVN